MSKIEIKSVPNSDLLAVLELEIAMYKSIDTAINEFGAVNTFMFEANTKEDFTIIGLYKDDILIGYVKGYCFSKNMFHFSGIYVIMKNNRHTKQLIEYCFAMVEEKGYTRWSVNATNGNIASIMEKYGAKAKHTHYVKEIV